MRRVLMAVAVAAGLAGVAFAQCGPAGELVALPGGGKTCRPKTTVVTKDANGNVAIPATALAPAITIDASCTGWTLPSPWACGGNGTISLSANSPGVSSPAASFHAASIQAPGNRLRLAITASPGTASHFDVQHCGVALTPLLNLGPATVTSDYTCTTTDDLQIIPPGTSSATITISSVSGSLLQGGATTVETLNGIAPAATVINAYTGNRISPLDRQTNRVLSLFEGGAGTEWVVQQGSISNDTTHLLNNSQSIKFTSIAPTAARADLAGSWNLTGIVGVRFKVWLDTPANFTGFQIWFSNSNFASFFNYAFLPSPLVSGWNDITMPTSLLVGTNSPSWASVDKIRLGCGVATSTTVNCSFAGLYGIFNQNTKGTVLFTFDDGFSSTYALAKGPLAKQGWAATEFVIADHIIWSQPGSMALAQLQELQNTYGWDIASHTMTHANLPGLTAAGMDKEFSDFMAWEKANGLNYVPAIAYPQGNYNATVMTEAAKYYLFGRSTDLQLPSSAGYLGIYSPLLYQYNMKIHSVAGPPSTTSLATAESWIDDAAANNTITVLVFHNLMASPFGSLDWSSTDFASLVAYVATKNVQVMTFSGLIKQWFGQTP